MLVGALGIEVRRPAAVLAAFQGEGVRRAGIKPDVEDIVDLLIVIRIAISEEVAGGPREPGIRAFKRDQADDAGVDVRDVYKRQFWFIEGLHLIGETDEARRLFAEMLDRRNHAGLLSEDVSLSDGTLWGNYPQTYSLVGLINCAVLLSRPWSSVR